jgi:hypothetical protein
MEARLAHAVGDVVGPSGAVAVGRASVEGAAEAEGSLGTKLTPGAHELVAGLAEAVGAVVLGALVAGEVLGASNDEVVVAAGTVVACHADGTGAGA